MNGSQAVSRSKWFGAIVVAICLVLSAFAFLPTSAQAQSVLFYKDYEVGNDVFDDALANLGITPTFTSSAATFATLLPSSPWDCVVALQQNNCQSAFYAPLTTYVAGGGRAILADWCRTASLGTAFEGSYTGSTNQTPITTGAHPIWAGLGASVALTNPGWGIWSMGLAPIAGGAGTGTFPNGNAAVVVGNSGRTLLNGMLSDTFATFSQGVMFAENEIEFCLGLGGPPPPPPCAYTAPVPTAPTNVGTFPPDGMLHYDPMLMRPFDLDDLGGNLIGTLMLPCWRNGNVDIYIVVHQSPYGQLLMNNFHQWLPFPANLVPWKANTTDALYVQLFSYLKSTVAAGTYHLDVVVVPSGTPTSAIPGVVEGTATGPYYKWRFTKTLP